MRVRYTLTFEMLDLPDTHVKDVNPEVVGERMRRIAQLISCGIPNGHTWLLVAERLSQ